MTQPSDFWRHFTSAADSFVRVLLDPNPCEQILQASFYAASEMHR